MNISRKIEILQDLYLQGELTKDDYIRLHKSIVPHTKKLHDIIRNNRKKARQ